MDWSSPASLSQFSVGTFSDKEQSAEENHGWSTGIIVTTLTDLTEHSRTGDTGNQWSVSDVMHDRNHGQRQNSPEQTGHTSLPSTGRHDIPVEDAKGTKPESEIKT